MYKGWAPNILDALFCDRKDIHGLYYWYDAIMEDDKFLKLETGETMNVTYHHTK